MHLQQTKRASAATGGPQYYFHSLTKPVKTYLRSEGAVPVALLTPYGATKSHFFALSKDHKFNEKGKVVQGSVGHDRIQQGSADESVGEAIRRWYCLPAGQFERIDIEIEIIDDAFYLRPTRCKYAESSKMRTLQKIERPLTFTKDYVSPLWKQQLEKFKKIQPELLIWSFHEIERIIADHRPETKIPHIQEPDILRSSGPLRHMGVALGAYVGKGYDCQSVFEFLKYPEYRAPVEIKKNSSAFSYQQKKYGKEELSRAVILCVNHNHAGLNSNIDVIELEAFHKYGLQTLSLTL